METRSVEIPSLLAQTEDGDPRVRLKALVHLCPCHVKRNHARVWNRVIAMAADPDAKVRDAVLHVITDGFPRLLASDVVQVLERFQGDPEPKVRRKSRKILAHYRRTGELNIS